MSRHPYPKKVDPAPGDVTRLLQEWTNGQDQALDRLVPQIHRDTEKARGQLHEKGAQGSHPAGDRARQ